MSVERTTDAEGVRRLTVVDPDGDRLVVSVWPDGEVILSALSDGGGVSLRDLDDCLAVLSFLRDCAQVDPVVEPAPDDGGRGGVAVLLLVAALVAAVVLGVGGTLRAAVDGVVDSVPTCSKGCAP